MVSQCLGPEIKQKLGPEISYLAAVTPAHLISVRVCLSVSTEVSVTVTIVLTAKPKTRKSNVTYPPNVHCKLRTFLYISSSVLR